MTEIKAGDIVICTDSSYPGLTLAKLYDVLHVVWGNWIVVINDNGEEYHYPYTLFETPKSESNLPPGTTGKGDLSSKPHLAYLDPHLEYEMGIGMRKGANKHGWNNHRQLTADAAQQILDSLKRHLNKYLCGERIDPETGVNHLACATNNINFLYRLDRIYGYDNVIENIYGNTK